MGALPPSTKQSTRVWIWATQIADDLALRAQLDTVVQAAAQQSPVQLLLSLKTVADRVLRQ